MASVLVYLSLRCVRSFRGVVQDFVHCQNDEVGGLKISFHALVHYLLVPEASDSVSVP